MPSINIVYENYRVFKVRIVEDEDPLRKSEPDALFKAQVRES